MTQSAEIEAIVSDKLPERVPRGKRPSSQARSALALRLAGASYESIAKTVGYQSANAAKRAVEGILEDTVNESRDLPQLRELTGRRIERLLRSVWAKATDEESADHLAYVRTALALIDRHARLMGVDAPQRLEVSTPDTEAKERWIRGMIEKLNPESASREVDDLDEDIIDAEVEG